MDQFLQLTPAGEEDLDDPSVDEATVPLNPSGDGGHVGNGRGHNTKLAASKSNVSNTSNQQKISYSGVIRVSSITFGFVTKCSAFDHNMGSFGPILSTMPMSSISSMVFLP